MICESTVSMKNLFHLRHYQIKATLLAQAVEYANYTSVDG